MTTTEKDLQRHPDWGARIVLALITALLLAIAVLLGITVLPRWWAHRIGAVADGSITTGVLAGVTCGAVFTAIPLLLLRRVFGRRRTWTARLVWLLVAAIVAVPNLITLMIVIGSGNAAHAGERTMDVDAPGFRGATLVGAVAAAVFVVVLWMMLFGRRRRQRELAALRSEREARLQAEREEQAAQKVAQKAASDQPVDNPAHGRALGQPVDNENG